MGGILDFWESALGIYFLILTTKPYFGGNLIYGVTLAFRKYVFFINSSLATSINTIVK